MADESNVDALRDKFTKLHRSVNDKLNSLFHSGVSAPLASAIPDLKLWLANSNGRYFFKYKTSDAPSYIDVKSHVVVPTAFDTRFMTNKNYGDVTTSTPIYGIRLLAASINASTITLQIPVSHITAWNNSDLKTIDESLSYFKHTVTGQVLTFTSMYHNGMQTVSLESDSVVIAFDTGLSLSDWECVVCVNYTQ